MAASGYTPIQLYYSTTASAIPTAGNLANGELAINITDGKIYYKNNSGVVTLFGSTGDVSTISFGTTGLTPSTATGGAVTVAGTLVAANGGTGQSSYTTGDLIYASGSTALSKLAIGTNGYVLQSNGTAPAWVAASSVVGGAAGSNTQIQYNNSGALGASSNFVFDGTNVGIGISSPSSPLSFASATGQKIRFYNSLSGYGIGVESSEFRFVTDTSAKFTWLNGTYSGGTTYMTLDANGRLLIGNTTNNTSFGGLLQVEGTDKAFANIVRYSSNAAGAPAFYLARSKSATLGTNTIVASGDTLGTILFAGANGTTYSDAAYIQAAVDGTPGASADMPGRLMFFTSADGSATPTERMRIDSSGNVGIGTSSPSQKLNVNGNTLVPITNSYYCYTADYGMGTPDSSGLQLFAGTGDSIKFGHRNAGTFTQRMLLDSSGNLGLGVTPSAWESGANVFQLSTAGAGGTSGNFGSIWARFNSLRFMNAAYYNGSNYVYADTGTAPSMYGQFSDGSYSWLRAASGTAGGTFSFTTQMALDASGNLGIGTSSPTGRLALSGTSTSPITCVINNDTAPTNQGGARISFTYAGTTVGYILNQFDGGDFNNIYQANYQHIWKITTAERMRIDSAGNVGINTSAPLGRLTVGNYAATDGSTNELYVCGDKVGADGYFSSLIFRNSNQGGGSSASIRGERSGNNYGTLLSFYTNGTGSGGSGSERMRINTVGLVGINNTSPTTYLDVSGSTGYGALRTPNILEISTVSATAATGTINYDVTTQSVVYYTSNASGNFTLNFRGSSSVTLNNIMNTGDTVTVTFLCTNGGTAYYNSAVQVDGSSVTPKWLGGTAPTSGNASSVDAYTYAIIKTGSAAFTVLASQTKFA